MENRQDAAKERRRLAKALHYHDARRRRNVKSIANLVKEIDRARDNPTRAADLQHHMEMLGSENAALSRLIDAIAEEFKHHREGNENIWSSYYKGLR